MIGIIIRLKAELKIQEAMAEIYKERIYDQTSQEHYNNQIKSVDSYKKAIKILEDNNK